MTDLSFAALAISAVIWAPSCRKFSQQFGRNSCVLADPVSLLDLLLVFPSVCKARICLTVWLHSKSPLSYNFSINWASVRSPLELLIGNVVLFLVNAQHHSVATARVYIQFILGIGGDQFRCKNVLEFVGSIPCQADSCLHVRFGVGDAWSKVFKVVDNGDLWAVDG